MKPILLVVGLILAILGGTMLLSDLPAPEARPAMAQAIAASPQATASPTLRPSPTADLALAATATTIAVQLAEINLQSTALAATVAADAATLTAYPPAVTNTAVAATATQDAVFAGETATAVPTATAAARQTEAVVSTATQAALIVAEQRAGQVHIAWLVGVGLTGLACTYLVMVTAGRRRSEAKLAAEDARRAVLENELLQVELEQARLHGETPRFGRKADGGLKRCPISSHSEARVAAYVLANGWNDAMRNGEGVGLSHDALRLYRQYLLETGVLAPEGNGYRVVNEDYFRSKLPPTTSPTPLGALP